MKILKISIDNLTFLWYNLDIIKVQKGDIDYGK